MCRVENLMKTKMFKPFFLILILLTMFGVSSSFAQTPDALVKELYKIHDQDLKKSSDTILNGKSRKLLDKFFDKTLADLIWKDLTTKREGVGVLDFDPFYNAQDFDVKNFSVSPAKIDDTRASVVVKFTNSGRKNNLNYRLVRRNAAWKITNIEYSDSSSLMKYFKKP